MDMLPEQTWLEQLTGNAPMVYEQQFSYVKSLFVYVDQPEEAKEDWYAIHTTSLLLQERFEGDCDDFAATLANWLLTTGHKNVQLTLVGNPYDRTVPAHVVVLIADRHEQIWVMDNREHYVMSWKNFVKKLRKDSQSILLQMDAATKLQHSKRI